MLSVVGICSEEWSNSVVADDAYGEEWKPYSPNDSTILQWNNPWKYRNFLNNGALPYAGSMGVYPGGGYILDLIGSRQRALSLLQETKDKRWIDRYTRVLFVSFTVYNQNANLFATVTVTFEMPTTGEIIGTDTIKTFRLFSYLGGYGIFVILVEILTLASVVYYLVREIKKIRKNKKEYFKGFWNKFELFTLLSVFVSVSMYIVKHFITIAALSKVTKLRGMNVLLFILYR